eukprot:SAG11_NODE_646_length_7961_cov_2.885907_5_plen_179_part_00
MSLHFEDLLNDYGVDIMWCEGVHLQTARSKAFFIDALPTTMVLCGRVVDVGLHTRTSMNALHQCIASQTAVLTRLYSVRPLHTFRDISLLLLLPPPPLPPHERCRFNASGCCATWAFSFQFQCMTVWVCSGTESHAVCKHRERGKCRSDERVAPASQLERWIAGEHKTQNQQDLTCDV